MSYYVVPRELWIEVRRGDGWTATLICPQCKRQGSLSTHSIDAKGIVYSSVACPWNRDRHPELAEIMDHDGARDCMFHENVRLDGWPPKEAPQLSAPEHLQVKTLKERAEDHGLE